MAEVLGALAEATMGALTARNGPRAWARRQPPKIRAEIWSGGRKVPSAVWPPRGAAGLPHSKAGAGRHLVAGIASWMNAHPVDLDRGRPSDSPLLAPPPPNGISFTEWVVGLVVSRDALAAGWGHPISTDPDEVDRRVLAELRKTIRRSACRPVHIAIAVLTGWGLPRAKAKDALKRAEGT
jgi:hypothetical protein